FPLILPPPTSTLFPYTTLFRSRFSAQSVTMNSPIRKSTSIMPCCDSRRRDKDKTSLEHISSWHIFTSARGRIVLVMAPSVCAIRSEEHTSELQSLAYLVCRLLL